MQTINFGIDLGTTNSVIAKFEQGDIHIFSNPSDFGRQTLPSVVAFRKETVFVGGKAKEYLEKRPKDVVGSFKRKMGTSESYQIDSLKQAKTPIELSAYVLKELKTFVPAESVQPDAVVITIPASFDTIQSNATKEAGLLAGFQQVILLQEPIAASLAFANKNRIARLEDGYWLVYDLGGGTFDVALVKIGNGEMKIIDHEGDNFLGGTDFDSLIVDKIIIPFLKAKGTFNDLDHQMKSASGKHNGAYFICLNKAEQAKITLSSRETAEIEIQITDDEDKDIDENITIHRSQFEALIKSRVDATADMITMMLERNDIPKEKIQFILAVGGSTYIPFVRKRIEEMLNIKVSSDIDPTTAIAIGAAYYAATKKKEVKQDASTPKVVSSLSIKVSYQKVSQEKEEPFAARIEGNIENLFFKISRSDGGFNTGLKPLSKQIYEELPLVENTYNFFTINIFDALNNPIAIEVEPIGIAHGKFGVSGQPLPNDICLEVDDMDTRATKLQLIFPKNSILPLRKTITKTLNKSITKGTPEYIRINVCEGPNTVIPEVNLGIGFLEISGKQLTRDIVKGSDIEITIEMSESRDLRISAYFSMADQDFSEIFNPKERHTPINVLMGQINDLAQKLDTEIVEAHEREDYLAVKALEEAKVEINKINVDSSQLSADDITDKRYQIEDKRRKIAQEVDAATKDKRLMGARKTYEEVREICRNLVLEHGSKNEEGSFQYILSQERTFLNSSVAKIKERTQELRDLSANIRWRTPEFLVGLFQDLSLNWRSLFVDQLQATSLIESGNLAISQNNLDRLRDINNRLINLLPQDRQEDVGPTVIGF
jgi:molecular chaperone DnaK